MPVMDMDMEWVITISGVIIAIAIAIYSLYRTQQPLTVQNVSTILKEAQTSVSEIVEVVKAGVFAAEQLKSTGKLPDNNAAFEYALNHAHRLLPDLDRATLTTFIESSVLLAKQVVAKTADAEPEKKS